jgi:hypothetical protein
MRSAGVWKNSCIVMEWGGEAIFTIGKIWPSFDIPALVVRSAMATNVLSPLTLSLTPCFSWVVNDVSEGPNRFSGFFAVND